MNNNLITTSDFDYAQVLFKYLTYFSYTTKTQDYYSKMNSYDEERCDSVNIVV